jgi:hypothetical protein
MDTLCLKRRGIFSTPLRGKPTSRWSPVPAEAVALHSNSIASLWEAKLDHFELLLQRETQLDVSQGPGRAEARWRWEESGYRGGGGILPNSGRVLIFFIRHDLISDSDDQGTKVSNWTLGLGEWNNPTYNQNSVLFTLSKGKLPLFALFGMTVYFVQLYPNLAPGNGGKNALLSL